MPEELINKGGSSMTGHNMGQPLGSSTPDSISIVTICFNNLPDLQATCASVDEQLFLPYEHIIIDGSTSTEIRSWLAEQQSPSYRSYLSELDEGISDAFNKGVSRAHGEIVLMLNAGDRLHDPTVLGQAATAFGKDASLQWLHGSIRMIRGGIWVVVGKPFDPRRLYRGMRSTFHPTMFVRRSLFLQYGLFDKQLQIAMDYDFLCRIARERNTFLKQPLAIFEPGGVSNQHFRKGLEEMQQVYDRHFGYSLKQRLWKWRQILLHRLLHSDLGAWLYGWKVRLGWTNR